MVEATGPCLPPGYLIFYHLPTKVENLPDQVDSFPTGEMTPTLVWCHPCSNDDQSPISLTLFGLSQEHKSSNTSKKKENFRHPSLAVEFLFFLSTFDLCVLQVSHKLTQIEPVNQWRTDCC